MIIPAQFRLVLRLALALLARQANALDWAGHVTIAPQDGAIEATDDVWINVESAPSGGAPGRRALALRSETRRIFHADWRPRRNRGR